VRHGGRESDSAIVPMQRLHNGEGRATMRSREQTKAAEAVEGRELAKGKTGAQTRGRTQRRSALQRARDRRRQAARRDHAKPRTALWPHVYASNRLREAYAGLNRDAAPGVDGQTGAASGENLAAKRRDLSERLKRGGGPARPGERVYSPQPDGRQRPIGIPTLEEKSVQRATVAVLNAIYAEELRGFS
jgi:RNA-directed DNA polymerase